MTYSGKTYQEMRRHLHRGVGAVLGVALSVGFAGVSLSNLTAQAQADPVVSKTSTSAPYLRDVFIDQVPILTPEFNPDVHTYTGTIYRTPQFITVKPMMSDGSNTATVNDQQLDPSSQRVRIPVTEGLNTVTIKHGTQTYTFNLTKVDTDYYGRKPIEPTNFTINGQSAPAAAQDGHELEKMWMLNTNPGSPTNYYRAKKKPAQAGSHYDPSATWWILDLGKDYNISKLFMRINTDWHPRKKGAPRPRFGTTMAIDFKPSTVDYFSPALNSVSLGGGPDGINHVHFTKSLKARYLRFTWMTLGDTTGNPSVYDLQVFEDTDPSLINSDLKKAPQSPKSVAPSEKGVNRGQSKLIDTGIMWSGWAPSSGYGRPTFTNKELAEWGNDLSMSFYDPVYSASAYPLTQEKVNTLNDTVQTNDDYLRTHPNAKWALALAPFNVRDLHELGEMEAKEFLGNFQKKYIGNATTFQFGDEAPYVKGDADLYKKWFDYSREHYPSVLLHSNQAVGFWKEANYKEYIQKARPDLLTFDYYPYRNRIPFARPGTEAHEVGRYTDGWNITPFFLRVGTWGLERKIALNGYDGHGQDPIVFGQYLDSFNLDASQSQKGYFANLSVASGMKWLGFFLFEHHWDGSFLWDLDDQPTHAFHEYAKIKRNIDVVSPYLARLNNTFMVDQPGQHKANNDPDGETVANPVPSMDRFAGFTQAGATAKNQEYGLMDISARNVGVVNNGLPGDVVVGYFDALPGLKTSYLQDKFGVDAPKALYVTNGLVDPVHLDREHQADWKSQRIDNGSAWQTAQDVTLTLRKDMNRKLMVVDPKTGATSEPTLLLDKQGNPTITLHLDGGTAALLYWGAEGNNPTREPEPEPVEPPAEHPSEPGTGTHPSDPDHPSHPSDPGTSDPGTSEPAPGTGVSEPAPGAGVSEPAPGSEPNPAHPSEPGSGSDTPQPHPSEPGDSDSGDVSGDETTQPTTPEDPKPTPTPDESQPQDPAPPEPGQPVQPGETGDGSDKPVSPMPKPNKPDVKPENPVKDIKPGDKKDPAGKDLANTGSSVTAITVGMMSMITLAGTVFAFKRRTSTSE